MYSQSTNWILISAKYKIHSNTRLYIKSLTNFSILKRIYHIMNYTMYFDVSMVLQLKPKRLTILQSIDHYINGTTFTSTGTYGHLGITMSPVIVMLYETLWLNSSDYKWSGINIKLLNRQKEFINVENYNWDLDYEYATLFVKIAKEKQIKMNIS